MNSQRRQKGISLLELVFMMSLVSILGLSVISNSSTSDVGVQTALMKVVSNVRFAQDRAIVTGINHGFRTISSTQYEIYELNAGNPITDPSTSAPMLISLVNDFKNVSFGGSYQIEFNSFGQPIEGGGSTVTLNKDNSSRTFTVTNNLHIWFFA